LRKLDQAFLRKEVQLIRDGRLNKVAHHQPDALDRRADPAVAEGGRAGGVASPLFHVIRIVVPAVS
jgi:hypothetical protein